MPGDSMWFRLAVAAPLVATEWLGLGPFHGPHRRSPSGLTSMTATTDTALGAIDTAGTTGRHLLSVLSWSGAPIGPGVLATETPGADADDVASSIARLVAAGLVVEDGDRLSLSGSARQVLERLGLSLSDQNAVTSQQLEQVGRSLGIMPLPSRKQDRIDAIAAHFADPEERRRVLAGLSRQATTLLHRIADVGGPSVIDPERVGLERYSLRLAATPTYSIERDRPVPAEVAPLAELSRRGIVGVEPWNGSLWIWREAWPLLDRPLHRKWPSVPLPATGPVTGAGLRLPPLVGLFERALQHWDQVPPAVLKSGDPRLAKGVLRSTAKTLATDEATIEIVASTALSLHLLLPNVVNTSGRGRNRTVDQVWLADPDLGAVWAAASAATRWLRIVAEWANPAATGSEQLVANRHLLLWELAALPVATGWVDDAEVGRWMQHRYAPMAVDEAVVECLRDLRALGMVTTEGPVGLTELGRLVLEDPAAVEGADFGSASTAIVQADETIICPPDLDAAIVARLSRLAVLESDSGALVFRLDEALVTKAVQQGESAEELVAFLDDLSSVPLPDTVRTMVGDAARRSHRVRVVAATTVVVTTDPADLATACALKSAKLTAVSDTVAVSTLAPEKVRQLLDRKGLAPLLVAATGEAPTARRSSDDAARLEAAARRQREFAERHGTEHLAAHAEVLERQAAAARDPGSRVAVTGPVAVTPAMLERVRTKARR